MKTIGISIVILMLFAFGFKLGTNNNYEENTAKRDQCFIKVDKDISDKRLQPAWDKFFKTAPFDVTYHYVIGKVYACVYNI